MYPFKSELNHSETLNNIEIAILAALSAPIDDTEKVISRRARTEEVIYKTSSLPIKRQQRYVTFSLGPDTEDAAAGYVISVRYKDKFYANNFMVFGGCLFCCCYKTGDRLR